MPRLNVLIGHFLTGTDPVTTGTGGARDRTAALPQVLARADDLANARAAHARASLSVSHPHAVGVG
jgi:hypothetical protein